MNIIHHRYLKNIHLLICIQISRMCSSNVSPVVLHIRSEHDLNIDTCIV